jgi:UDP-N-acetylglucosamine 1-carboxyvinyltransferase
MDCLIINGQNPLNGSISINGAKNAALPLLAACLLTKEKMVLHNIPNVEDVKTMCDLLRSLGVVVEHDQKLKKISVQASDVNNHCAAYEIVSKMRASIWVLSPLLARFYKAKVSLPGGCALGARRVHLHIAALEAMGAEIHSEHGYIVANSDGRLQASHFDFDIVSVGATISAIMAACLATGTTVLHNCAQEPEIQDLCFMLNKMGAKIENIGLNNLKITGVEELSGTEYSVMSDRIEIGSYMVAALITKGRLQLDNITNIDIMDNVIFKLSKIGAKIDCHNNVIVVDGRNSKINAIDIQTKTYPGFPTDLQPLFSTLMCVAKGTSVITENIFENRFMAIPELCRMGASITLQHNAAIIQGVDTLYGAEVMASDLRGAMALVVAALCAEGTTTIQRIYHLDRGYENLEENLRSCGADITRHKAL